MYIIQVKSKYEHAWSSYSRIFTSEDKARKEFTNLRLFTPVPAEHMYRLCLTDKTGTIMRAVLDYFETR